MGLWDRLTRTLDELSDGLFPDAHGRRLEEAQALLQKGKLDIAAATLEKVLVEKPEHAGALQLLGLVKLQAGAPAEAAALLDKVVALRPGLGGAWAVLGDARLALGDPEGAADAYRQARDLAGSDTELRGDAHRGLGYCARAAGDPHKAVRELRKALAENPDDTDAATALADLVLDERESGLDEARQHLERLAARKTPPAGALVALGRVRRRTGDAQGARRALLAGLRGADDPRVRANALEDLARIALAAGDLDEAAARAGEAIALKATLTRHALQGEIALASGDADTAIRSFEAAGDHRRALLCAWRARDWASVVRLAGDDVLGQAARFAAGAGGDEEALVSLSSETSPEALCARLSRAQATLDGGDAAAALALARETLALSPDDDWARELVAAACARQLGGEGTPGDPYGVASRLLQASHARDELTGLAVDASRAIESYDRPLLVTVMGEFSSGKSTLVNAFLGAEIAPMGVTPTTATINVVKYGRTPSGRIVYQDDTTRDLSWDDVARTLSALGPEEARRIRHVEVLYPGEVLEQVHVVDTPGLNSILPEHEATARAFIAQADAVVWVFAAAQAGKKTEREALEAIRAEGKRVLAVLNKVDQLGAADVARLLSHLKTELGGLVEDLVPVAGQKALAARITGDGAAVAESGWPQVAAALEERFFQNARLLKREALVLRLGRLFERARRAVAESGAQAAARASQLSRRAQEIRDAGEALALEVAGETRSVAEAMSHTYRAAARDVLDLVRPRRLPFGQHSATAADRDYLVGLLERGVLEAVAPLRARVRGALESIDPDASALVEARVFSRLEAYLRGYLRGGRVDEFFMRVLPRLDLEEDAVYHALFRDAPDLDTELLAPLAREIRTLLGTRADRLTRQSRAADAERWEREDVLLPLLESLAKAR